MTLVACPREASASQIPRLRPLNGFAGQLIRQGVTRPPTLHQLIVSLDRSNAIVFLETGVAASQRDSAHLQFMAAAGGQRYLRVSINLSVDRRDMIVLLAHELHHALEVAAHPEVVSQDTMRRLYETIGQPNGLQAFETVGAAAVSSRVRDQWVDVRAWERSVEARTWGRTPAVRY
jgi:hypothetical protein